MYVTELVIPFLGFTDLGNTEEFSTEMLEWRLGRTDVIHYSGDLMTPPDGKGNKPKLNILGKKKNKTLRGNDVDEDSSDNDDW